MRELACYNVMKINTTPLEIQSTGMYEKNNTGIVVTYYLIARQTNTQLADQSFMESVASK